jgi:hypothetical protein
MGAQPALPTDGGTPVNGYSANGDPDWDGLCSFACGLGAKYCLPAYCSQTATPTVIPTVSPFNPPACTRGEGSGALAELCSWTCGYGFCPYLACTCTNQGPTPTQPTDTGAVGYPIPSVGNDHGLCAYAFSHGNCPNTTCTQYEWPAKHPFAAYGDSYAVGVGCGDLLESKNPYDTNGGCFTFDGAYPWVLNGSLVNEPVQFVACSGAPMNDIYNTGRGGRASQLALVANSGTSGTLGWSTLSVGGNDVDFGMIAQDCLFWWNADSCNTRMANSRSKINSQEFVNQLATTYINALDASSDPHHLLVVMGYVQFFDASESLPCDKGWFLRK